MSSLFDKLRTLANATAPGRRDPLRSLDETSSDDELKREIERLEREVAELEAKQAELEAARSQPSDEAVVAAVVQEIAEESAETSSQPVRVSDALKQELMAESAEIHQRVDATNEAAQAVADKAAELAEQAESEESAPPTPEAVTKTPSESVALAQELKAESAEIQQQVERTNSAAQAVGAEAAELADQVRDAKQAKAVDDAKLAEARRALDSAEKEIAAVPAGESDAVKRSAAQAQELIAKARAHIRERSTPRPTSSILRKAHDAIDAAAKGVSVPSDASDAVRKSAQQANDLIEKARRLITEKRAEADVMPSSAEEMLEEIIDEGVPSPPRSAAPSREIDDIKRRLG